MRAALLLASAVPLAAVKTRSQDALGLELDAEAEAEARPVMKVVKLLQDMNTQLQGDLKDDKEVHEEQTCFCDNNEKAKTQAIEDGGIKIESLKAFLGEAAGKSAEMKVKLQETKKELAADQKALGDAKALRMKENKAFAKDEAETIVAIKATTSSIEVLKKHNPELLEIRKVASELQNANVAQLGLLDNLKRAALKDFLHDAQGATSFLAIPGFKSYGSQSGQIFGILNQMKDDFEDHLREIRLTEKLAVRDFNALENAKKEQIADGKKDAVDLDKRLGTLGEKQAQASKDLKDATAQKDADVTFLNDLRVKCAEQDKEYDVRVRDRTTEIQAVESAISTLNDEDAFKLFDKTVSSFLQVSSETTEKEKMRRQSAASALERVASQTDSPVLAMLAGRVRLDAFTEVKKAISDMVEELSRQQKDEQDHKTWCTDEFHSNKKDTEAAESKKSNLEVKRDDLKKSKETLDDDIKTLNTEVAEIKKQMDRASSDRERANADYQTTITDQRMAQMVLNKALNTLKQVYALLQNGARSRRQHVPAGPKFNSYDKSAGGKQVISLLEGILGDSKKAEGDAIRAENDAQSAYEEFMLNSNKALNLKAKETMTKSGNRAAAKEDLNLAKKDLVATNKRILGLGKEKADLHQSCDFIIKNFKDRQDARSAEMDALKEAMSILSGGS